MKRLGVVTRRLLLVLLIVCMAAGLYIVRGTRAEVGPGDELAQAAAYEESGRYLDAIEIYSRIVTEDSQSDQAITAHGRLLAMYLNSQEGSNVRIAIDTLMAQLGSQIPPRRPRPVEVSEESPYRQDIDNYKAIVAESPDVDQACIAQRDLVLIYIKADMPPEADKAVDDLLAIFQGHKFIPKALYTIARSYEGSRKKNKAQELYERLIAKHPGTAFELEALARLIILQIPSENPDATWQELEGIVAAFAQYESLPGVLYNIAKKYEETASYEDAMTVYGLVTDHNQDPEDATALRAPLAIARCRILQSIDAGDDQTALILLGDLIDQYPRHEYLQAVICKTGEHYYKSAFAMREYAAEADVADCLNKAVNLFQMAAGLDTDSEIAIASYYCAADCLAGLRQYQPALEYYGQVFEMCRNKQPGDSPGYAMAWDSLFKMGRLYQQLKQAGLMAVGQADPQTENTYMQLVAEYPNCPASKIARRWLSRQR